MPVGAKPPPGFALPAPTRAIHKATKDGTQTGAAWAPFMQNTKYILTLKFVDATFNREILNNKYSFSGRRTA
jgi:hypothetical protein